MEPKKKDQKIASSSSQEPETNDLLHKEEHNQPNVALAAKSTRADNPSNETAQYPSILQWPHTLQNIVEQPSPSSRPCVSTHSTPSIAVSQWHQLPHLQINHSTNQIQQGNPPPHLTHSTTPFWPLPCPGYHPPGMNATPIFHPFAPLGAMETSWQVPAVIGGGTSSKDHSQVPNFCYQVGYPYTGFPGPWDALSWWGQLQQSQPSCTYSFPKAYGCFSSQPPMMPGCSASLGQPFPRGIIRPPERLSQKHHQLWEAQSAENVQLWTVIGQLQLEVTNYKTRIMKLEAEVSSRKQAVEEPTAPLMGTIVAGQASKRGRPKRSFTSADALHSPNGSQPRARSRKPAQYKVQTEAKAHIFEKVCLNKEAIEEKTCNPAVTTPLGVEKISNMMTDNNGDMGVFGSNLLMSSFHNQVHQEMSGIQICGVSLNSSSEMKSNDDKTGDASHAFTVLSRQAKGFNDKGALSPCLGARNNASVGWLSTISSEDNQRNVSNTSQGGKVINGWSFVSEDNGSDNLEDAMVASAKDENGEEMGDDASSGGEDIACTKDGGLPQFSDW